MGTTPADTCTISGQSNTAIRGSPRVAAGVEMIGPITSGCGEVLTRGKRAQAHIQGV
jgi:hypothetical protein